MRAGPASPFLRRRSILGATEGSMRRERERLRRKCVHRVETVVGKPRVRPATKIREYNVMIGKRTAAMRSGATRPKRISTIVVLLTCAFCWPEKTWSAEPAMPGMVWIPGGEFDMGAVVNGQ